MKTSREFGYAYAEWGQTEKQDGFDGPVDVNAMLGGSVDIPEGDYRAMRNAGIEPDAREYWEGYNSYFTSLAASTMGRKGGKSKSDAKTSAARENGKRGGRPHTKRIVQFFRDLRRAMSDPDIAAGLGNGEIERPEWMAISESADHLKAWDTEDPNASREYGFVHIDYNEDE